MGIHKLQVSRMLYYLKQTDEPPLLNDFGSMHAALQFIVEATANCVALPGNTR